MFKLQKRMTATLNNQITATSDKLTATSDEQITAASDKQKPGQNKAFASVNIIAGYSRKLKTIFFLLFILLLISVITAIVSRSTATFFPAWSDPLEIPVKLSANFGEIRPDHWHMGLDIRTNGKENYNVRSVAGGYVSRIVVGSAGYGKAVYITHPNNRTSLYAHLNTFYDKLETFMNNVSLKTESWEQDINLQPGMFPVTKGMFIGLSGNTGHSEGPHLHFEWRNSLTGNSLNPQLEVLRAEDKEAPVIEDVYWYDRRQSISQQNPHKLNISSRDPNNIIEVTSPIVSLGITAVDKISQSSFNMGIYQIKTFLDEKPIFRFSLDSISERNNKNINGCIDYATWFRRGNIIQHLSKLKGGGYDDTQVRGTGIIRLSDKKNHVVKLEVQDIAGNTCRVQFIFRYAPVNKSLQHISSNVRVGLPVSIQHQNVRLFFTGNVFYEDVFFRLGERKADERNMASDIMELHDGSIPLKDSLRLMIRASRKLTGFQQKHTVLMIRNSRTAEVINGNWKEDWFETKVERLGDACLVIDTTPPVIKLVRWKNGQKFHKGDELKILVSDNLKQIRDFRAEINNHWVPFSQKTDFFVFRFRKNIIKGDNKLMIKVTDMAGNITSNVFRFEY